MDILNLKEFLEEKVSVYNQPRFIHSDPIQVPHSFSNPMDIEIAAFLTATIAWGNRTSIIKNAFHMMKIMGNAPYDFICNLKPKDCKSLVNFKHRTFNNHDFCFFLASIQNIYLNHNGLHGLFSSSFHKHNSLERTLIEFRKIFLTPNHEKHTEKHISNIEKGSAAKRINLFLRWMIRRDNRGVDFGIWDTIPMSALYLPLDVHTGAVARKMGLLNRKSNDWKAVNEVTRMLRKLDAEDPVRYDYALFGLGIFEKF